MNMKILILAYAFLMAHAAEGMDEKPSDYCRRMGYFGGNQSNSSSMSDADYAIQLHYKLNVEKENFSNYDLPPLYTPNLRPARPRISIQEEMEKVDVDVELDSLLNNQDQSQVSTVNFNSTLCNEEDEGYFLDLEKQFGNLSVRRKLDFSGGKSTAPGPTLTTNALRYEDDIGLPLTTVDETVYEVSYFLLNGFCGNEGDSQAAKKHNLASTEQRQEMNIYLLKQLLEYDVKITPGQADDIIAHYFGKS